MPGQHDNTPVQTIIYKPNEHADEYIVAIDDVAEWEQWKSDKSIALSRFVGQFAIYKSATSGHTGQLGEISKQEMETAFFGDDKKVKDKSLEAAIQIILENGKLHKGDLAHSLKINLNQARGGGDNRGAAGPGGSHR